MFIGYMPIISDNYPMKGLFQCPPDSIWNFYRIYYLYANALKDDPEKWLEFHKKIGRIFQSDYINIHCKNT